MNGKASGPGQRKPPGVQTVRLALLFTLFMLAVAFLLWKFGMTQQPGRAPTLWIVTEPTQAVAGLPVTLFARVTDGRRTGVEGIALNFVIDGRVLQAVTDKNGSAEVTATFAAPGEYQVDVAPAPTEKRDFQVLNRASIPVTVEKAE